MSTLTNAFALLADQQGKDATSIIALKTAELKKIAEKNKKIAAEKKKAEAKIKNKKNKAKAKIGDGQANEEHSGNQNEAKVSVRTAVQSKQELCS